MDTFRGWCFVFYFIGLTSLSFAQATIEQLCQEAQQAFDRNDFPLALKKANEALAMDSLSTEAHRLYQDVRRRGQDRAATIAWYSDRVTRHPTNAVYAYLYARMLRDNIDSMKVYLRRAVQLDPTYYWGNLGLASVLWNDKSTAQEALTLLDKAEAVRPHTGIVRSNRALAYLSLEQYNEALPIIHEMYENEISGNTFNLNTTLDYLGRAYEGLAKSYRAASESGKETLRLRFEEGMRLFAKDPRALGAIIRAAESDSALEAALSSRQEAVPLRRLVGRWESVNPTKGGIGNTFEVVNDSLCVRMFGVLVGGTYRIERDSMFWTTPDAPTKEQGVSFVVAGDSMVQGPSAKLKTLRRAVPGGSNSVEDIWWYRHPSGPIAFEEYAPDGKFYLRMYMTRDSGTYAISGNLLTFHSFNSRTKFSQDRIVVTDSSLTMIPVHGKTSQVFRRVWMAKDSAGRGHLSNGFTLSLYQTVQIEQLAGPMPKRVR